MVADNAEIARRENGRLVVRPGGVRVGWDMTDLTSSDGHAVRAVFRAAVRGLEASADRKLLEETFLGGASVVTAADVARHFAGPLNSIARRQAQESDVQSLLLESGKAALLARLVEAGRAAAFNCGVELMPPLELELESPTLRAQQEDERRSAAQSRRMTRAAELFKQFQEIRSAAPDLPVDKILQRLGGADPAEQAEMLRCLLLSSAGKSAGQALWVVAGPHLLRIEPQLPQDGSAAEVKIHSPPAALGPFRSVQRAVVGEKAVLLLGAQSGVLLVDPQSPTEAQAYADPAANTPLGFNAVAIADGMIWATHGQGGLVGWKMGQTEQPAAAIRTQPGGFSPRNLCVGDDNRLIFSSEHRLFFGGADGSIAEAPGGGAAAIVAIVPEPGRSLLVVREDGELCRHDPRDLRLIARVRRAGPVTAAGALPWMGGVRLILATQAGPILCVGLDDELVTQYVSHHGGLRLTTAAADRVAAVSADRQRVLIWPAWDGRQPAAEIHVGALARHRVADMEFA